MQISITNGTLTSVQETLSPSTNYNLPNSITVTGAASSYNSTTGNVILTNLTQTMTITASGESTITNNVFIGNLSLAKAFVGNNEVASMWLGNVKLYEGTPAPSGYSGNIAVYESYGGSGIYTKIKFDTPPTSDDDYDSMTQIDGSIVGLTSYQNKTKIYVWGNISSVKINNVNTSGEGGYSIATEVLLTGNYDIYLAHSSGGSND